MTDNLWFPHSKLDAYQLARKLVRLVHDSPIHDAVLRKHAFESARACAINTAEGAARWTKADKSRMYVIARAELCESVACYEIASDIDACTPEHLLGVQTLGKRVCDMLSRLVH